MIAGVDYDTNRIAVCALGDVPRFHTVVYRPKGVDAFVGTMYAYAALRDLLLAEGLPRMVDQWWIEHAFGKGPTDFKLGRVQGAILSALRRCGAADVHEAGPSEWKKGIGLNGNAAKAVYVPDLLERIRAAGGGEATEHEADAYGLACYGARRRAA